MVDGTEVLKFCKTVGLLTVAVVPVATAEATTCPAPVCSTAFAESTLWRSREPAAPATLAAGEAGAAAGLPPLCEALVGVCIGGLTSVTVGTVFAGG